ncbi:MAG: DUF4340 domain-containing protein [Hyphomicrobiales bacterium]|nr:DUF4340 domain-containing protein [Hyphomicrobiales bacterium]
MTARSFLVLALLTVVMVIAAALTLMREDRPESITGTNTLVFPDLLQRIDNLAGIRIENADGTLTIESTEQGWGLKERDGYPVAPDKIKDLVISLARLTKIEPKTARADLYAKLGVENVDVDGATSQLVILEDKDKGALAKLIVGKAAYGLGEEGGVYIRLPDEARSWAARGRLNVGRTPEDWLSRRVADIPVTDLARVQITHADGQVLTVTRAEDGSFTLQELPEGGSLRRPNELRSMASAISDLSLSDVRAADDIEFSDDKGLRARFETTGGLIVSVLVNELDGQPWLKLSARAQQTQQSESADQDTSIAAQAEMLNDRWRNWVFGVPEWKIKPLRLNMAELLNAPGDPQVSPESAIESQQ